MPTAQASGPAPVRSFTKTVSAVSARPPAPSPPARGPGSPAEWIVSANPASAPPTPAPAAPRSERQRAARAVRATAAATAGTAPAAPACRGRGAGRWSMALQGGRRYGESLPWTHGEPGTRREHGEGPQAPREAAPAPSGWALDHAAKQQLPPLPGGRQHARWGRAGGRTPTPCVLRRKSFCMAGPGQSIHRPGPTRDLSFGLRGDAASARPYSTTHS